MDKNEKIAVAIGAFVLLVMAMLLFVIRGCTSSDNIDDVVPETDTLIIQESVDSMTVGDVNNTNVVKDTDKTHKYYLQLDEDIVVIYSENGEFYDYARIDITNLPEDVYGDLKMGMEIIGEDSLYEFLQGYAN